MNFGQNSYIPYGRQFISQDDIQSVVEALKSPFLTQGPVVPNFEQAVAVKVSSKYAVAVNSATSALHIACMSLGLSPGDRLWTSPITFVASANCARYCGADVDFVDIDPSTGLMSIQALTIKLEQAERLGTLPKVVVPVHLAGSSCDMAAIGILAKKYGFLVLEDASHAIGGSYRDSLVGSCKHSHITVFSFHPVKIITTGEGGVATTNNQQFAQSMAELRSHGIVRDHQRFKLSDPGPWAYEQQQLGYNYRMTDIQAALGLSQLKRLDDIVHERNRQFEFYRSLLQNLPVQLLEIPESVRSSVHLAVVLLEGSSAVIHRRVFEGMRNSGVGVQLHYTPVHLQPYYRELGFSPGQYPHSEAYATTAISLPLFPGLSMNQQEHVVAALKSQIQVISSEKLA